MHPSSNPKSTLSILSIFSLILRWFFYLSCCAAKVRRLYDIANILMSLGLIRKKTFIGPAHTKRPGYSWCGASMKDIDAIRKSHTLSLSLYNTYIHVPKAVHRKHEQPASKLKGPSLSRRASYGPGGGRPFLHQYEVKGLYNYWSARTVNIVNFTHLLFSGVQQPYSSALCVPTDKKGFKRSLSFGATPTQNRPSCVTVRPCKKSSL